jgi:hypothetical protein
MDNKRRLPQSRQVKPAAGRRTLAPDRSVEPSGVGSAGVKAGFIGAAGMAVLMLISLVQLPLLPCLVIPGFITVLLVTGLLGGVLAGDRVQSPGQATQVGLAAGFTAGLGAAAVAVVLAAAGLLLADLGAGVRAQFSPAQLNNLADMGISTRTVEIGGAVAAAVVVWGVFGTLIAVLLGMLGARLYYRLK